MNLLFVSKSMKRLVVAFFVFNFLALSSFGQKVKTVKIGMCSDVHLPTMHDGAERLTSFLDSMKTAKPDFIKVTEEKKETILSV